MEKEVNRYSVQKLTERDIATYIQSVFNSDLYINIIKECNSRDDAYNFYRNIGKIIIAYVTSTGDTSLSSANRIMQDFKHAKKKEGSNFNISHFYTKYVLPLSMTKLGYNVKPFSSMTISEIISLEQHLEVIAKHNKFYSHSFNGALKDRVESNGLDISQELFAKEFASLARLTGETPFKKGKLCYVELGEHSFKYASKSPERLFQMISPDPQKEDETLQEYYKRALEEKLKSSTLPETIKQEIRADATKIIDFYYGKTKSCIAIIENKNQNVVPNDFINWTYIKFLGLNRSLKELLKNDQEIRKLFDQVKSALENKTSDCLSQFENFRKTFNKKYPENHDVELMVQDQLISAVTEFCLNDFNHNGHGDGYEVPTGKIAPENISIATFDNIHDLYVKQQQIRKKEEQEARYKLNISEIKTLLNAEMEAGLYYVDPNKYGGTPYEVLKDSSVLAQEEGLLIQQLNQLWFDGEIDLKKKNELLVVIKKEYAKMKLEAPKPQQVNQQPQQFQDKVEAYEPIDIYYPIRKKYGYDTMSDDEKQIFDERLERATRKIKPEPNMIDHQLDDEQVEYHGRRTI